LRGYAAAAGVAAQAAPAHAAADGADGVATTRPPYVTLTSAPQRGMQYAQPSPASVIISPTKASVLMSAGPSSSSASSGREASGYGAAAQRAASSPYGGSAAASAARATVSLRSTVYSPDAAPAGGRPDIGPGGRAVASPGSLSTTAHVDRIRAAMTGAF
jgi:hypothetical protein